MKILIKAGVGAGQHYRDGWKNAFTSVGHTCVIWKDTPAFDIFDKFKPDLFIGNTWELDTVTIKCLKEYTNTKVILEGSQWGDMEIDPEDPVLMAQPKEIKLVDKLKKEVKNQFAYIFKYYSDKWLKSTMNGWTNIVPVKSVPLAADILLYTRKLEDGIDKRYKCDIAFVGGYWPYKAQEINKYLIPLCHDYRKYKIKIFGSSIWPTPQYQGLIKTDQIKHVFASAAVCPCIYEPLSIKYGFDVSERIFKIMAAGGFVISQYVESAATDFFTDDQDCIFVKSPQEFRERIEYFINHSVLAYRMKQNSQAHVLNNHTYHNRCAKMFEYLELQKETEELLKFKEDFNERFYAQ